MAFDGVRLVVRFYEKKGELYKIEEATGVSVNRLKGWLYGKEKISRKNYEILRQHMIKRSKHGSS
jgi:hypothetical protein